MINLEIESTVLVNVTLFIVEGQKGIFTLSNPNHMGNIKQEIGQLIQQARKEKGFTLKELAELTGVTESTFSRYESGKQNVSFEQAQRIADVLGKKLKIAFE